MFDLGCLGGAEEGHSSIYPVVDSTNKRAALFPKRKSAVDVSCAVGEAGPCARGSLEVKHWPAVTLSAVVGGRLHHPTQTWSPDWTFQLCCLCGRPVTSLPPGVSSPSLSPRWKDYHG